MEEKISRQNKTPYIIGIVSCLLFFIALIFSVFPLLNHILIGTLGITTYLLIALCIVGFIFKIKGSSIKWKKSFKILTIIYISLLLLLLHYLFSLPSYEGSIAQSLEYCYKNLTVCGVIGSIIIAPLASIAKLAGTIIILLSAIIIIVAICIDKVYYQMHLIDASEIRQRPIKTNKKGSMQISNDALIQNQEKPSFISMPLTLNSVINKQNDLKSEELKKSQELFKPNPILQRNDYSFTKPISNPYLQNSQPIENVVQKPQIILNDATKEENINVISDYNSQLDNKYNENSKILDNSKFELKPAQNLDDMISNKPIFNEEINNLEEINNTNENIDELIKGENEMNNQFKETSNLNTKREQLDEEIRKINKSHRPYVKPPLELLTTQSTIPNLSDEQYEEKARVIEQKLEEFKINAKCIGVTRGPAITRFEFEMPQGVSVNKIMQYANDISMVLEARKSIRIEAPIPGKNAFGIEVPNDKVDTVGLRDLVSADEFKQKKSPLTFALGKDITNKNIYGDIGGLVHTLVAGSTGSGKSVCMNSILISLLYKATPDDVRILLIDPKFVEFNVYENLPHLLVPHIITEPAQAVNALNWAIEEMERRNRCFGQYYVRSISEYNDLDEVKSGEEKKMPYIVIMVDELADLMLSSKKDIEDRILRLAQKARSAGIHMILATQRPSVDIITGTIKANLPSRIAFSLTNFVDSKTIIDQGGAEKLLGRGDMLYMPRDTSEPFRLLGPFITQKEVVQIVKFVKANNDVDFDEEIEKAIFVQKSAMEMFSFDATSDEYFVQAVRVAIEAGSVSTSFIQRKFGVGYQRASKLIDQMEALGYITEPLGANKGRKVLITEEEFLEKYGG